MGKREESRLGMFGRDGGRTKEKAEGAEEEVVETDLEDSLEESDLDDGEELLDEDQDSDLEEEDEDIEEEDEENPDDHEEEEEKSDSDKWEEEKTSLEKRNSDTQAEFTRKSQELAAANKLIAELEEEKAAHAKELDDAWLNSDDIDDVTKQKFLQQQEQINKLEARDKERENAQAEAAFEEASKPLKEKYDDFDKMIDLVKEEYESNEKLRNKFVEGGRTPEVAYKLGLNLFRSRLMVEDPVGYNKYLKKLQKNKNKEKSKKKKAAVESLDAGSSKTPSRKEAPRRRGKTRLEELGFLR